MVETRTREELIEWSRRFPNPIREGEEAEIEVRQVYELEDFGPVDALERFRAMGVGGK